MTIILVLSDAHIPDRAFELSTAIREFIEQHKPFDIVVYAGDFTGYEFYEYVKSLGKSFYGVAGNMDFLDLPEYVTFRVHGIKFGVIHGDQVYPRGNIAKLTRIAKRLQVQVLVSGHTHSPFIVFEGGVLHLNPGSVTGVPSGGGGSLIPSFMIVKVSGSRLEIELFEEREEEHLTVSRREIFELYPLEA